MSGSARWARSPLDNHAHLLLPEGDHPSGALKAWCGAVLTTVVTVHDRQSPGQRSRYSHTGGVRATGRTSNVRMGIHLRPYRRLPCVRRTGFRSPNRRCVRSSPLAARERCAAQRSLMVGRFGGPRSLATVDPRAVRA